MSQSQIKCKTKQVQCKQDHIKFKQSDSMKQESMRTTRKRGTREKLYMAAIKTSSYAESCSFNEGSAKQYDTTITYDMPRRTSKSDETWQELAPDNIGDINLNVLVKNYWAQTSTTGGMLINRILPT